MTSSTSSATAPANDTESIIDRARHTTRNALATGALQPIRTEQTTLTDGARAFSVRWVSSLALKDRARVDTVIRRRPDFNPFLPPDPELCVAPAGDEHLIILNKFPVMDCHLLIITRAFEAQTAPLTCADFAALGEIIGTHGGLGFYNGGSIAGASQPHKHLQWVPAHAIDGRDPLQAFAPDLAASSATQAYAPVRNPALPWAHAYVRLPADTWTQSDHGGTRLKQAFETACTTLSLPRRANPMPPYNLLINRNWLLLVPRSQEKWRDISVNSLAYAGSLFVRDPEQIEHIRHIGPLAMLAAVGIPA